MSRDPPKWATSLIEETYIFLERYDDNLPSLEWKHAKGETSSGVYLSKFNKIIIRAGKSRVYQKMALLHEISHAISGCKINGEYVESKNVVEYHSSRNEWHTVEFWELAFRLYRHFNLPMKLCKDSEFAYCKRAKIGYRKSLKGR